MSPRAAAGATCCCLGNGDDSGAGQAGRDIIEEDKGDDTLNGNEGRDLLVCGPGFDTCINGEDDRNCEA